MLKWTGGYFLHIKTYNWKMLASFLKASDEEKLFQNGEITVNERRCLIGMLDAGVRINDKMNPNWAKEVRKWSVTITTCSISIHWKSKELEYIRKISTRGDKWFKSSTIISRQSIWSIRFTATMKMGALHLWCAIILSIRDQFWQMRFQNHCD